MNSKVWDIWYVPLKNGISIPKNSDECLLVPVSDDELDKKMREMPIYLRFINQKLWEAGIDNLYVPKDEFYERIDEEFRPEGYAKRGKLRP